MKRVLGVALGITVMTVCQAALAFRTAEDSLEFARAGKVGWKSTEIPFVMQEDLPSGVSASALQNAIELSLAAWSNAGCVEPRMYLLGYAVAPAVSGDGTNTIQWVSTNWTERGFPKSAAALADVQYQENDANGWDIVETDIYLNADNFDWSGMTDESQDVGAVVLHEAGHALGLLHPCETDGGDGAPYCATKESFSEAVMYPVYQSSSRQLGTDDIAGVCYLYPGESGCSKTGCASGEVCTSLGCQESCGGQVCLAGYYCKDNDCVRPDLSGTGGTGGSNACGAGGESGNTCNPTVDDAGTAQLWDPCQDSKDCIASLTCSDERCTVECSADSDCGSAGTCSKKGLCVPVVGVFGEDCDAAEDCASRVCLTQDNEINRCTRECSAENADCPDGWECDNPDGKGSVCMPKRAEGCSCRVVRSRRTHAAWASLMFGILAATWFGRRCFK